MRLFELFDNPVPKIDWEETVVGEDARFYIGDYLYNVSFTPIPIDAFALDWSVLPKELKALFDNQVYPIDIEFEQFKAVKRGGLGAFALGTDGTYEITGTGNEVKVFSTVVNVVQEWLKNNPEAQLIHISAKEPSRIRLYRRMVNSLAKGKKVWEIESQDDDTEDRNTYWIIKL